MNEMLKTLGIQVSLILPHKFDSIIVKLKRSVIVEKYWGRNSHSILNWFKTVGLHQGDFVYLINPNDLSVTMNMITELNGRHVVFYTGNKRAPDIRIDDFINHVDKKSSIYVGYSGERYACTTERGVLEVINSVLIDKTIKSFEIKLRESNASKPKQEFRKQKLKFLKKLKKKLNDYFEKNP